jgi:hypothetical protein
MVTAIEKLQGWVWNPVSHPLYAEQAAAGTLLKPDSRLKESQPDRVSQANPGF